MTDEERTGSQETDNIDLGMTADTWGEKGMTGTPEHRGMQPASTVQPVTPPPPPPAPTDSASSVLPNSAASDS
jgi:hypothetical protein